MPIYNPILLSVDTQETRRYAGLRQSDFPQELLDEACLEAQLLAQPRSIWEKYDYDPVQQIIHSPTPCQLLGKQIGKHLSDCHQVIVLASTIGEDIEQAVTKHFTEGKYAYSTLLDAAATTAIEQVADSLEKYLQQQLHRQGLEMKWRYSPGYGDWPIEQQPEILKLSNAPAIGIGLTESLMLMPRKSITAVIGLFSREKCQAEKTCTDNKVHDCSKCEKKDCPFRNS